MEPRDYGITHVKVILHTLGLNKMLIEIPLSLGPNHIFALAAKHQTAQIFKMA